jgi:hypothetical protein
MRYELKERQALVYAGVEFGRMSWQLNMDSDDENFSMEFIQGCCIRAFSDLQKFYIANYGHQLPLIPPKPKHKKITRIKSKNQSDEIDTTADTVGALAD